MDIQAILTTTAAARDLPALLHQHLHRLPSRTQLQHLIDLFQAAAQTQDELAHLIYCAWSYLLDNRLWSCAYPTLQEFKLDLDFDHTIAPLLTAATACQDRLLKNINAIRRRWLVDLHQAFPPDLVPPRITYGFSREIHRLSKLISLHRATILLKEQVNARIASPNTPKSPFILPIDALNVRQNLTQPLPQLPPPEPLVLTSNSTPSTPAPSHPTPPSLITPTNCRCPSNVLRDLTHSRDDQDKARLFDYVAKLGFDALCHPHLRTLASLTLGLYNNITHIMLTQRLTEVHCSPSLDHARSENPDWFQKSLRPESEADYLIVYRFPPLPPTPFRVHPQLIFTRFGGADSWATWQKDGTIILPDLFDHLQPLDLQSAIDVEFEMYRYHYRPVPGRPAMGFLRNMFHSLIQQVLRQDVVAYAIMVAARPDNRWRLTSYPYTAKYSLPGTRTGFLHLDLNLQDYFKTGRGGNMLTSSVSLDDEDDDNCTLVVPGFHRHIQEWHRRRIDRRDDSSGTTTNCSQTYLPEDRRELGYPVPRSAPKLGFRVTLPQIIHGSTPISTKPRRVIYTWLSGVEEDLQTFENKGTLDWDQVSACHRNLEAPARGVGGDIPTHSVPPFRFPASLVLESSSALGDALVARRRWDDPEVLSERDILFGPDHEKAGAYVRQTREELVRKYRKAFGKLEGLERRVFGENSYFLYKERNPEDVEMEDI